MTEGMQGNGAPFVDGRQIPMFDAAPIVDAAQAAKAAADAKVEEKAAEAAKKAAEAKIRDSWATPKALFDPLHAEFNFTLDVCAELWNRKLDRYYGPGSAIVDAFQASWAGERWWCNPPFSEMDRWLDFAWRWFSPAARQQGLLSQLGVMLLPATRTEQEPWQKLVEPFRDKPHVWQQFGVSLETRFITMPTSKSDYGRVQFDPPPGIKKSSNTAGSVLLIWHAY